MTKKYLTKKLLLETKWIRKPETDGIDIQTEFKLPYHIVTYCLICQDQHSHRLISEGTNGGWYSCIGCIEEV